jgi:hypothetical protein
MKTLDETMCFWSEELGRALISTRHLAEGVQHSGIDVGYFELAML